MTTTIDRSALCQLYTALACAAHIAAAYARRVDVGSEAAVGQPEVCGVQSLAEALLAIDLAADMSELISDLGDAEMAESSAEYAAAMASIAQWSTSRANDIARAVYAAHYPTRHEHAHGRRCDA